MPSPSASPPPGLLMLRYNWLNMRACQYHDNIINIKSMTCHHVSQCQSWSWLKQSPCQSSAWTKPASAWASTHSWQRKPTSGDFGLGELMMMIVIIMREKPVQLPMLWNWLWARSIMTSQSQNCHRIYTSNPQVSQFSRWSHAERLLALDQLIESCEPQQVRHMMQVNND